MHRADEIERLLVAPDRRRDQDAVDLVGVDDVCDGGRRTDDRLRQAFVLLALRAEEADDFEAVLRMSGDLSSSCVYRSER